MSTKQHAENLVGTIADADEFYLEQNVSGTWTPFRSTFAKLKTYVTAFVNLLFIKPDEQHSVNTLQALLASNGNAIVAGQGYVVDNGGVLQLPTGVSLIELKGVNLLAGVKGFNPNVNVVYTNGLHGEGVYDVATNKLVGKFRAHKVVVTTSQIRNMFYGGNNYPILIPKFGAHTFILLDVVNFFYNATTSFNNGADNFIISSDNPDNNPIALDQFNTFGNPSPIGGNISLQYNGVFDNVENADVIVSTSANIASTTGDGTLIFYLDFTVIFY